MQGADILGGKAMIRPISIKRCFLGQLQRLRLRLVHVAPPGDAEQVAQYPSARTRFELGLGAFGFVLAAHVHTPASRNAFCALPKISPSVPFSLPSASSVWR